MALSMATDEGTPDPPPIAELTDSSLVRRIRKGNQDAATQLYFRYADRLRNLARAKSSPALARRVDADDIVQSVFSTFFRGMSQGYYDVPSGSELWKLLLVIALNKVRAKGAHHRAAKRDVQRTASGGLLDKYSKPGQEANEIAYTMLKLVIDETLEALPPLSQQMIALRIEGHKVTEIAAQTQRSKRTIERVLQEFRSNLAKLLEERV